MSFTPSSSRTHAERIGPLELALLVAAVVLCRVAAVRACPTYDDAFITYRYAANMAAGQGLVFNPGSAWEPVLGTTTVLYALVMAGLSKLGVGLVLGSLVFNVVCDALSACLIPRLFGMRRVPSALALLAFAALPQIVRISVGGMESPLFAVCGLAAVVALESERPLTAGFLAGATCLVRPEGVLLAAILFVARARRPRELVRYTLPVLALGVVAVVALSAVYGTPIPQSVLAKSAMQGPDAARERTERLVAIVRQAFLPYLAYAPLLPFVAFGTWRALKTNGALRLFSLWPLAIIASYLVARPHAWGWYFYVPLVGWCLWLALGLESAWLVISARFPAVFAQRVASVGPLAGAVLLVVGSFAVSTAMPTAVEAHVYAPMWNWAEATSKAEPHARILASDIGAIGYRWHGTVLDSEGLVWPDALRLKSPLAMIEAEKPEYLLVVAERPRLRHLADRPDVMAHYAAIKRFNTSGATRLDLAPEDVPMNWSPDYLLYKRRDP